MEKEQLQNLRHTLSHLMAQAVKELYPNAKLTLGPAIDNGFYYDIDFGKDKISDTDLPKVEKLMRKNLASWREFSHKEVSKNEAQEVFSPAKSPNEYKTELIDGIVERGEKITIYTCGGFSDLCRGGHCEQPSKEIPEDCFKLDRVAGAYWRGDEKNPMLTRIYGLAFASKKDLDDYISLIEEAKKRDHRKLGKELDLFTFSELVGAGLPLWTPKGTVMRHELDGFVWELRKAQGFERVTIPHITRRSLYETSGHWSKFSEELFKINTREGHEFAMKPMNCPHHTQIFAHLQRSYRDMPQRYAETTMVYRDEQSGELAGLSRVLCITQDDAHVFCRYSQVKEEFLKVWDMIDRFYSTFGFKLRVRLSLHDPENMKGYLGAPEVWEKAEGSLRDIIKERGVDYFDGVGEAAMYGPKIDFMAHDSIGREHQVATIQLDMNLPERFDLYCVNEKGEHERIVMIHCAIMGSIERFASVLIEHLAGAFPVWLSPVQVAILPISSDKHLEYSKEVAATLQALGIRTELHEENDTLGKKIRSVKEQKTPYMLVIGDAEVKDGTVTVEHREKGKVGAMPVAEFLQKIKDEIISRSN